jgi:hypothetical protein
MPDSGFRRRTHRALTSPLAGWVRSVPALFQRASRAPHTPLICCLVLELWQRRPSQYPGQAGRCGCGIRSVPEISSTIKTLFEIFFTVTVAGPRTCGGADWESDRPSTDQQVSVGCLVARRRLQAPRHDAHHCLQALPQTSGRATSRYKYNKQRRVQLEKAEGETRQLVGRV